MNQQKSLIRIAELLSRFKVEVNIHNANAQLDINIISEDILIPLLNIAYNCDFQNAKYSEEDTKFPALDLLDKKNRIAFQITSTSTIKKIRSTINGIVKNNFYNQFDTFYVYIITQKQKSYDKTVLEAATKGYFNFTEKNILDESDLYKKVASLTYPEIKKVENLLEQQFSDMMSEENRFRRLLLSLIDKLKVGGELQNLRLELEGLFEIREIWVKKKIFYEKRLPRESDMSRLFQLETDLEEIGQKIIHYNNKISSITSQISENNVI